MNKLIFNPQPKPHRVYTRIDGKPATFEVPGYLTPAAARNAVQREGYRPALIVYARA